MHRQRAVYEPANFAQQRQTGVCQPVGFEARAITTTGRPQSYQSQTSPDRRGQDYHASHALRAMQIVRDLGAAGRVLRPSVIKRCEEYSTDVLGHRRFVPWLLVYSTIAGTFKEGWIPDNFYGAKVVPAIQGPHGHVSFLKSVAGTLFQSERFPNVGSRINGSLYDNEYQPLSFEMARSHFFDGTNRVVFKPDGTGRGKGIRFFDERSFDRSAVGRLGNGVFQRFISQHPLFDKFSATSVATIRLTTVVEQSGAICLRAAHLRLGTGSDTHVQVRTQVRVPLNLSTGELAETGLQANWHECDVHPTTGEAFSGTKTPGFEQCVRTALVHHQRIPFVGSVGWDLAVDRDERAQIIEWNGYHNGITFSECMQGPCFLGLGWERYA